MRRFEVNFKNNINKTKFNYNITNIDLRDEIFYVNRESYHLYNKLRRLMVARTKRILKKNRITKIVWVSLGKIISIFKKGLNQRMGKGDGSFFSVKRLYYSGSYLIYFFSKRYGFSKILQRYIKSKITNKLKIFYKKKINKIKINKIKINKIKINRFFKKNKKIYRDYHYSFNSKKRILWYFTYRMYRRYKHCSILKFKILNKSVGIRFYKSINNRKIFRLTNYLKLFKKRKILF
jgi:hypothetical protein